MRRVYVYNNKSEGNGKLMAVEDSIETFKSQISLHFDIGKENIKLYSSNGCEIVDLRVIRDDEKLYLSLDTNSSESCETDNERIVSDWITLNVGGRHFTTSRGTLLAKEPLSMLARMFADENSVYLMNPSAKDSTGAFLIDRSPDYFKPILNYLRHGDVILDKHINPTGVLEEAVFYGT